VAPLARQPWRVAPGLSGGAGGSACQQAEILPREHLAQYAAQTNPFVALNTAFLNHVAFHHIPRGTVLEQPIEITYEATPDAASHPRTLIVVGANTQCTIVETYQGSGQYFTNAVTEIVAGDNAIIYHY